MIRLARLLDRASSELTALGVEFALVSSPRCGDDIFGR